MLIDTGITTMFLTVPEDQAAARVRRGPNRSITLAPGSNVTISARPGRRPTGELHVCGGRPAQPAGAGRITFIRRGGGAPFVNTSVRFLNGFDYLFDDDGGRVGFRWTGHVRAPGRGVRRPRRRRAGPDPRSAVTTALAPGPDARLRAPGAADM